MKFQSSLQSLRCQTAAKYKTERFKFCTNCYERHLLNAINIGTGSIYAPNVHLLGFVSFCFDAFSFIHRGAAITDGFVVVSYAEESFKLEISSHNHTIVCVAYI